jgi:hypothetical protein
VARIIWSLVHIQQPFHLCYEGSMGCIIPPSATA